MLWIALWATVASADIVDMEAAAACEPCPAGQEERPCNYKRGTCAALEAAGWEKRCSFGNGANYCRLPGATDPGPAEPPGTIRIGADGKITNPREPESWIHPPLPDAPTPALHPEEEAAAEAAEKARAEAEAAAAVEPAGCGCASSAWSPAAGLLLLLAAAARRSPR